MLIFNLNLKYNSIYSIVNAHERVWYLSEGRYGTITITADSNSTLLILLNGKFCSISNRFKSN